MSLPSFLHSNFISLVIASISVAAAEEVPVTGLAPEITDLNSEDVSFQLEKDLPYLKKPFIRLNACALSQNPRVAIR